MWSTLRPDSGENLTQISKPRMRGRWRYPKDSAESTLCLRGLQLPWQWVTFPMIVWNTRQCILFSGLLTHHSLAVQFLITYTMHWGVQMILRPMLVVSIMQWLKFKPSQSENLYLLLSLLLTHAMHIMAVLLLWPYHTTICLFWPIHWEVWRMLMAHVRGEKLEKAKRSYVRMWSRAEWLWWCGWTMQGGTAEEWGWTARIEKDCEWARMFFFRVNHTVPEEREQVRQMCMLAMCVWQWRNSLAIKNPDATLHNDGGSFWGWASVLVIW